jgi:hypothetical protein
MRIPAPCRKCGGPRFQSDIVRGGCVRCAHCRSSYETAPRKNAPDQIRIQRMCLLYREGHTLQQIGTVFGVSRERVRQIIVREGVTWKDGGLHRKAIAKKEKASALAAARLEFRANKAFGCGLGQAITLNDGNNIWAASGKAKRYRQQRKNAERRNIDCRLSFPEWCQIWADSGHWHERGRHDGDAYVMARRQDFGPYAPWNVYITTWRQNVIDYRAELRKRGVACTDGYKRLPERAAALGIAA